MLACGLNSCSANSTPRESCGLYPVLIEDFNALSVSPNKIGPARWTAHTPWHGDFGDAVFYDPEPDGPFSVSNGILSITARKNPDGRWQSGLLAAADPSGAGFGTQYGYFETRVKFPPGKGTWPAFWLMPLKPASDRDGLVEIDVVEYYGHETSKFQSVVHVWFLDQAKKRDEDIMSSVPANLLIDDFNTFGVDISPEFIVFYLNGSEFWRQPTPPELDGPMYPLINLALGSGWPIDETPSPSVMLVDYVHVWGRSAEPAAGCPKSERPT